ncbi:hypothetical protein CSUB01_00327 [Colletotrichum sublineola]|uniref:Uncharacterized protein n=1 Tax=Colletotrichum sublineola TaxID=1173701 RepID=A0A066WYM6_COLSU|nr:hypothetical protein CSUB01_00327 [Colletotrichum sublineola]
MDQNGPSTPRVITEQPVSCNGMIQDPGVQRRRGPAAHTDEQDAPFAEEITHTPTPETTVYTTPGHHRRRQRKPEAGMVSDGILGLVGFARDTETLLRKTDRSRY